MPYDIVQFTAQAANPTFRKGEVTGFSVIDIDYDTYEKLPPSRAINHVMAELNVNARHSAESQKELALIIRDYFNKKEKVAKQAVEHDSTLQVLKL